MTTVNSSCGLQLRFEGVESQLALGRQLLPIEIAMGVLNRDEDGVKWLYESGHLQVAFDLASAGTKRAEVRIWRQSIIDYGERDYSTLLGRKDHQALAKAISAALPPGEKPVLLAKLRNLWWLSSTHLHNLLEAREFCAVPGQRLKHPHSPLLERASLEAFLTRRRIT